MDKGTAIAAFLGYLGTSILGSPSALAQQPGQPIRFGEKGELTYEFAQPYEGLDHRMTTESRQGKNWGRIYISHDGNFHLWGYLDGAPFLYVSEGELNVQRDNSTYSLLDRPPLPLDEKARREYMKKFKNFKPLVMDFGASHHDQAYVDLSYVNLGPNFFESPIPQSAGSLQKKLHELYSYYIRFLNVAGARAKVEEMKKGATPEKLEETLDSFGR